MKDSTIIQFPGTVPIQKPPTRKEINDVLKQETKDIMEYYEIQAPLLKKKYEELRKQGFTPEQALALCSSLF